VDRPLVGVGFRADNIQVFDKYAPRDAQYDANRGSVWVAHSIYFQALGEHGFVGLALYLSIWIWVWVTAARYAKLAERLPGLAEWVPMLLRMCQVSTVGFLAGGAFLSLMNLDLPFYILAFVTLAQCAVKDHVRDSESASRRLGVAAKQDVGGASSSPGSVRGGL
jgi:O-antigen ligase